MSKLVTYRANAEVESPFEPKICRAQDLALDGRLLPGRDVFRLFTTTHVDVDKLVGGLRRLADNLESGEGRTTG
jgi:hypothetical protein